ncbi:MAG: DUF134 domain-containing protein [Candidatus Colwellbacteria bacterium]|nr:DUF134 domain-containing protein [Candidatus Colwellbacteria bacterium]MDD3752387.1 DUF134 domain-containing protein [Candidatus Colwellbacteria bacterium]MDD4818648.1 DUF134 domain-containing protein [Candidatus Colwellbacteria bacterium]
MPRPRRRRRIGFNPSIKMFKPQGVPARDLEAVLLSAEEVEAVRLKYIKGFDQNQCAEQMDISQSTFQRILYSANQKIADVLINGKTLVMGE